MIPHDIHLRIGSLLFDGVDQIDLTGPFEVLSFGRFSRMGFGKTWKVVEWKDFFLRKSRIHVEYELHLARASLVFLLSHFLI